MAHPNPPVVNFPPHQEISVLAHIVSDDDGRLGQIFTLVAYCERLKQSRDEVLAELAALRAHNREVVTQQDYLAGPEEQIRQILLESLDHEPPHKKGDYELRTETFECLYGERGSMDALTVGSMSLLPTVVKPINGLVELHEMREKECQERNREPRVLTNFNGGKFGMYVQENGEPREGETLSDHEKLAKVDPEKLAKDQFAKNVAALEEARKFQRSAKLYWNFCVTFEFPKTVDQEAMEKAAEHLIKTVPREHLVRLMAPTEKGKRHYVRHRAEDRKQDMKLATNI